MNQVKIKYLLIDREHRVFKVNVISGYLRAQAKKGNLMILNPRLMKGMSISGFWEDIQDWKKEYLVDEEPLVSV